MRKLIFRVFINGWQKNIRPQNISYEQLKTAIICGTVVGIDFKNQFEKIRTSQTERNSKSLYNLYAIANSYYINESGQKDLIVDGQKMECNGLFFLEVFREDNPEMGNSEFFQEKIEALTKDITVMGLWRGPVPSSLIILYLTNAKTNDERRKVFKQLYADLIDKYGLTADERGYDLCKRIPICYCKDAYFNDSADEIKGRWPIDVTFDKINGFLVPKLIKPEVIDQQVSSVKTAQSINANNTSPDNARDDAYLTPTFPDCIYEKLPEYLRLKTSIYSNPQQKDIALVSLITALSSIFINVQIFHAGKWHSANLYFFVVAPPASHKSAITEGINAVTSTDEFILERSISEKKRFDQRDKDECFGDSEPPPPITRLTYPMNASAAALIKRLGNVEWGALLHATEIFSFLKNGGESWGTLDDLFCAAFHNEPYNVLRNDYDVRLESPKLSILCSGTPEHALQFLPSTSNGLFSRFLYYFHATPDQWNKTTFDAEELHPKLPENIDEICLELYKYLETESTKKFSWTQEHHKNVLNAKLEEWLLSTRKITSNSDNDATVKRMALNIARIACVLSIVRTFQANRDNLDFMSKMIPENITCNDDDLEIAIALASVMREHSMHLYENMQANNAKKFKNQHSRSIRLYDIVDEHFFRKEILKEVMERLNISDRTVGNYLATLVKTGLLKQGEKEGEYFKIKTK